jgi:hypothetical protein
MIKKLLTLLLLILIGCSKPINSNELVLRDDKYFVKNSTKPYSGKIIGQILGKSKDGILNGETSYFYKNGNLLKNGNLSNGVKEGEWKFYNENGTMSKVGTFTKGNPIGDWKFFDEEGDLVIDIFLKNDRTFVLIENGVKSITGQIDEDLNFDGKWVYYNEEESPVFKIQWNSGNKFRYQLFNGGNLSHEIFYRFGFKTFSPDSIHRKLRSREIMYSDGGNKLWEFTFWDNSKSRTLTYYDKYGRKESFVEFNKNGEEETNTTYYHSEDNNGSYMEGGYVNIKDYKKGKSSYFWWSDGYIVKSSVIDL